MGSRGEVRAALIDLIAVELARDARRETGEGADPQLELRIEKAQQRYDEARGVRAH